MLQISVAVEPTPLNPEESRVFKCQVPGNSCFQFAKEKGGKMKKCYMYRHCIPIKKVKEKNRN